MKKSQKQNQEPDHALSQEDEIFPTKVSLLLGHRDSSALSKYESGHLLPSLAVALQLAIILRIPVEFLFPELYSSLQNRIREQEEGLHGVDRNLPSHHSPPPT